LFRWYSDVCGFRTIPDIGTHYLFRTVQILSITTYVHGIQMLEYLELFHIQILRSE